jgi:hypothetical protein
LNLVAMFVIALDFVSCFISKPSHLCRKSELRSCKPALATLSGFSEPVPAPCSAHHRWKLAAGKYRTGQGFLKVLSKKRRYLSAWTIVSVRR